MYPDNFESGGFISSEFKRFKKILLKKDKHFPGMSLKNAGLDRKLFEDILGEIGFQRILRLLTMLTSLNIFQTILYVWASRQEL